MVILKPPVKSSLTGATRATRRDVSGRDQPDGASAPFGCVCVTIDPPRAHRPALGFEADDHRPTHTRSLRESVAAPRTRGARGAFTFVLTLVAIIVCSWPRSRSATRASTRQGSARGGRCRRLLAGLTREQAAAKLAHVAAQPVRRRPGGRHQRRTADVPYSVVRARLRHQRSCSTRPSAWAARSNFVEQIQEQLRDPAQRRRRPARRSPGTARRSSTRSPRIARPRKSTRSAPRSTASTATTS